MKKMTHEFETRYIDSYAARVRKPGAGETALVTDYGSLDNYLDICKKHYEERRAEFFDSMVETENLPLKAKRFASMAKTYMGLARTILRDYGEFETYHQAALDITDRIVKESGIVLRNLDLHYEKMKEILPKGDVRLIRLSKDVEDGINFFSRAVATQIVMNRREEAFTGGPAGIEMREEMKANEDSPSLRDILLGYLRLILEYCNRIYLRQLAQDSDGSSDILKRFHALLEQYFLDGRQLAQGLPTVTWCASELAYSPRYFGDLIHKATGGTAIGYIHNFVINQAKSLLMNGHNISETSRFLGFDFPHHFTRLFKNLTGITPTEFLGK